VALNSGRKTDVECNERKKTKTLMLCRESDTNPESKKKSSLSQHRNGEKGTGPGKAHWPNDGGGGLKQGQPRE